VAVKASPLSALSVGEQPDLFIPLQKFKGNMQDVFANVAPHKANLVWESGPRRNRRRTSDPPDSRYRRMSTASNSARGDSPCGWSCARKLRFFADNGQLR